MPAARKTTITAQDIIDLLPIVADQGWWVGDWIDGCAIRNRDGACPLCALGKELSGEFWYRSELDPRQYSDIIPGKPVRAVMSAADDADAPLRPALLAALGLAEPAA